MKFFVVCLLVSSTSTAQADQIVSYLAASTEQLTQEGIALPDASYAQWLEDPEFRVSPERDVDNLWTQTYSLRFRPTGGKERRLTRSLSAIDNEMVQLEFQQLRNQALATRYHQLLDLAAVEIALSLARQHRTLDDAELSTQRTLSARAGYSGSRLQRAVIALELRDQSIQQNLAQAQVLRAATVGTRLRVDDWSTGLSARLSSTEQIAAQLESLVSQLGIESSYRALEVNRAQDRKALARAQRGFGLSFVELSYDNKGLDSYNMTFGFRLPTNSRAPDVSSRTRELIRAERDAHIAQQRAAAQNQQALQKLQGLRNHYNINQQSLLQSKNRRQSGDLGAQAQQIQLRHEFEMVDSMSKAHIEVARLFVDVLATGGMLDEQPIKNWLAVTP